MEKRVDTENIDRYMNRNVPFYLSWKMVCSRKLSCVDEVDQNLNNVSFRKKTNK